MVPLILKKNKHEQTNKKIFKLSFESCFEVRSSSFRHLTCLTNDNEAGRDKKNNNNNNKNKNKQTNKKNQPQLIKGHKSKGF